jgi:hypothetical protein
VKTIRQLRIADCELRIEGFASLAYIPFFPDRGRLMGAHLLASKIFSLPRREGSCEKIMEKVLDIGI